MLLRIRLEPGAAHVFTFPLEQLICVVHRQDVPLEKLLRRGYSIRASFEIEGLKLTTPDQVCDACLRLARPVTVYRYAESGLSGVILRDIEVADCHQCGNSDVIILRMVKIHRAIANSPARLGGEQLRFHENTSD